MVLVFVVVQVVEVGFSCDFVMFGVFVVSNENCPVLCPCIFVLVNLLELSGVIV